jgi:hypothetical protein
VIISIRFVPKNRSRTAAYANAHAGGSKWRPASGAQTRHPSSGQDDGWQFADVALTCLIG